MFKSPQLPKSYFVPTAVASLQASTACVGVVSRCGEATMLSRVRVLVFHAEVKRLAEKEDWAVGNDGLTSLVSSKSSRVLERVL